MTTHTNHGSAVPAILAAADQHTSNAVWREKVTAALGLPVGVDVERAVTKARRLADIADEWEWDHMDDQPEARK